MTDRDDVIKRLEHQIKLSEKWDETYRMISIDLLRNANTLLKGQKWHLLSNEMPPKDGDYLFYLDGIKYGFPVICMYENDEIWWWGVHGRMILDKSEYNNARWTEIPRPYINRRNE